MDRDLGIKGSLGQVIVLVLLRMKSGLKWKGEKWKVDMKTYLVRFYWTKELRTSELRPSMIVKL